LALLQPRTNSCDNILEEEEGISEISQVDEDNQYEEELADKKVGYDSSCDHIQEEDIQHHGQPAEEKENNSCLIQKLHRPPPPLTEEEIDLLLNSHVATPAYTDLQHPHSLEYLVDSVLFHEKEVVVMFNHPEECLVFENDLDFDVKAADDEEDNDIFRNLFQDQIADFSMQKPSGFYSDFPVFDKYSDDEEDFKDLLSNEISSNPIYQLRDDQKSMNAMVENRYESVVQESNEDPFNFDTSSKDIIVGEGDQKFFHDAYFQTRFLFDHYQDSNVGNEEHISSSLLKIVSCNRPAYHSDEFRLQGYDEREKTGSDQQLIMHVSPTNIEQSTFNIQISKGNKKQHFSQLEQQQNEVFLCDFYDPVAVYMESKWGTEFFISDFLKSEFQNCKYLLPGHVLKFAAAPVILLLKDGSIIKFVSQILAWLIWKFSYT
jgi:hypothetical protein